MFFAKVVSVLFFCALFMTPAGRGGEFDLDRSQWNRYWKGRYSSAFSDESWKELKKQLAKYPMKVMIKFRNKIIIQIPTDIGPLLGQKTRPPAPGVVRGGGPPTMAVITEADRAVSVVWLIARNADEQLHETMVTSYMYFITSSRPSTWGSLKCLAVPDSNYVAHFNQGDNLIYCIGNMGVHFSKSLEGGKSMGKKGMVSIAKKINCLFQGDHQFLSKNKAIRLFDATKKDLTIKLNNATIKEGSTGVIVWKLSDKFKKCWVRIDSEAGELSILDRKKMTVSVKNIPKQGTKAHIYAISPDGQKWYHAELQIPAAKERSTASTNKLEDVLPYVWRK